MSGPIETTSVIVVAGAALFAAVFVVPLPRPKPEEPPRIERAAEPAGQKDDQAHVVVATEPPPPPPSESDDHRIRALEQSVYEIQKDQQELKDEIRALVEEIKAK